MLRSVLMLFLFSMACMGQTFQYSRGWTNGKRSGGINNGVVIPSPAAAAAALSNFLHKEDDGLPELFDIHDASERRLERCLLQLQHLIRNPLLLHSAAAALALNPLSTANANPNANNVYNNNNNNSNNNNNPFVRSHQSNELFEELTSSVIDANDYGKH